MSLEAVERHVDVLADEQPAGDVGGIRWVVQKDCIKSFEQSIVEHYGLTRAALLGGGSQKDNLTGEFGGDGR